MEFKIGETYGDSTSLYFIYLDKTYTIGEFIDQVLKERPNEWCYIKVLGIIEKCEYSKGKLLDNKFTSKILSKKIKYVDGHGGYGLMDYIIKIEE